MEEYDEIQFVMKNMLPKIEKAFGIRFSIEENFSIGPRYWSLVFESVYGKCRLPKWFMGGSPFFLHTRPGYVGVSDDRFENAYASMDLYADGDTHAYIREIRERNWGVEDWPDSVWKPVFRFFNSPRYTMSYVHGGLKRGVWLVLFNTNIRQARQYKEAIPLYEIGKSYPETSLMFDLRNPEL